MLRRSVAVLGLVPLCACATAQRRAPVDLEPARAAVQAARDANGKASETTTERASEALRRAESDLRAAEAANARTAEPGATCDATAWARATVADAACAIVLAQLAPPPAVATVAAPPPAEAERLVTRARKAEEDQHRLEERIAQLQRELELTETEVIRIKARLKGNETKAEASSAIAEARILTRRIADDRGRSGTLARCQELVARAEQLLKEENYGAAAFFALKAQDTAAKASQGDAAAAPAVLRAPPQKRYVVKVAEANVRRGPDATEPVLGTVARGTTLDALAIRGDWLQVSYGSQVGWVHRGLIE